MIFETLATYGHEQVVFCHQKDVGLKAIIAIHNTVLGPSLGGLRMWAYKTEQEALNDVLRLSRGMTYKNAVAGLNLGGGKAVIIGDPTRDKSEALFRAFGRFVQSLGGRYITAEDVGIDVNDMEYVFRETEFVHAALHRGLVDVGDEHLGALFAQQFDELQAHMPHALHGVAELAHVLVTVLVVEGGHQALQRAVGGER